MSDQTGIEWTDATWNPLRGCSRVSEGCRHCYAETVAARFSGSGEPYDGLASWVTRPGGKREARWTGDVRLIESHLLDPLRWQRPRRIFVNSMSDLFHEKVPDEWIDRIFAVMALAPQHTFQILTKRPERMRDYVRAALSNPAPIVRAVYEVTGIPIGRGWHPPEWLSIAHQPGGETMPAMPNVWLGVSVEDQATADTRIPYLLDTPAAIRFISAEPLLGAISLDDLDVSGGLRWNALGRTHGGDNGCLDWVIVGGESGPGARPMHPAWARQLRDQCVAAGVPFFFKQWGEWAPGACAASLPSRTESVAFWHNRGWQFGRLTPRESEQQLYADEPDLYRLGKRAAGRLLDGVTHDAWPASPSRSMEDE